MNKLNNIVEECLRDHVGGEKFFDSLDSKVTDQEILESLLSLISSNTNLGEVGIITSGKFSEALRNHLNRHNHNVGAFVSTNGGLRKGNKCIIRSINIYSKVSRWIFVDDSYYSGTTKKVVCETLLKIGIEANNTFVVYDGSKSNSESIFSLYKYYK